MSLYQQIATLLIEPPGNIIYHLVTLFALQVVFAISLSQWLRDRDNRLAWRFVWASGGLVLGRLLLYAVGLLFSGNAEQFAIIMPPLEQAFNTITAVTLIWALVPPSTTQPRLGDVLLLISLLIIGLLTFSFLFSWQRQISNGLTYGQSTQTLIWLILQIAAYTFGLALVLRHGRLRKGLPLAIFIILLGISAASLLVWFEGTAVDTNILFWTRLGYLCAFPLWAVVAYRQSIAPLLAAQQASHPAAQQLAASLTLSTQLLQPQTLETRAQQAVIMLAELLDASFVGVGVLQANRQTELTIFSNLPQTNTNAPRQWQIDLSEWAPYRSALRSKNLIELGLDGRGSRHLYELYHLLEIRTFGTTLVVPMLADNQTAGTLLLAKADGRLPWSSREKAIAPVLAEFIAQALLALQIKPTATPTAVPFVPDSPGRDTAVSGRIIALEAERDKLKKDLDTATNRALQAESRAVISMKRAHDLAQTLEEMERLNRDEQIESLQREIDTLRESLNEAEEAVAIAAAGESGLSPDWVMLAITRYSGQLEEAHQRIEKLEKELERRKSGALDELVVSLIQELRTPMTSIGGFTDLLLGETLGILGTRQRDLLQRIQANTKRLGDLLDQMLQLALGNENRTAVELEAVDVQDVLETAVTSMMPQIRDKSLRLDLDIHDNLPALNINRTEFEQMMTHLLGNALQASGSNGRVRLSAYTENIQHPNDPLPEPFKFLQIDVTDSGAGIQPQDLPHVFEARHQADKPLIQGLGDKGAGLSVTNTLAIANGGRIWVDSTVGEGSTFSLLFPLTIQESESNGREKANGSLKETH